MLSNLIFLRSPRQRFALDRHEAHLRSVHGRQRVCSSFGLKPSRFQQLASCDETLRISNFEEKLKSCAFGGTVWILHLFVKMCESNKIPSGLQPLMYKLSQTEEKESGEGAG